MKVYEINAFSEAYGRENYLFTSKAAAISYADDIRENDNAETIFLRTWAVVDGLLVIESNEPLWDKYGRE